MIEALFQTNDFVLGQGSMCERLRREEGIQLAFQIFHASLVYSDHGVRI